MIRYLPIFLTIMVVTSVAAKAERLTLLLEQSRRHISLQRYTAILR